MNRRDDEMDDEISRALATFRRVPKLDDDALWSRIDREFGEAPPSHSWRMLPTWRAGVVLAAAASLAIIWYAVQPGTAPAPIARVPDDRGVPVPAQWASMHNSVVLTPYSAALGGTLQQTHEIITRYTRGIESRDAAATLLPEVRRALGAVRLLMDAAPESNSLQLLLGDLELVLSQLSFAVASGSPIAGALVNQAIREHKLLERIAAAAPVLGATTILLRI